MTERRYHQYFTLAPLVVGPIAMTYLRFGLPLPQFLIAPVLVLGASVEIAGIPYVMLAVPLLLALWRRPLSAYYRLAAVAPIVLCIGLFAYLSAIPLFLGLGISPLTPNAMRELASLMLVTLVTGYGYVGLWYVCLSILRRLGVVSSEIAHAA
jgi:hypothetical protein